MLDGQIITLKKGLQYKVLKPLATGGQGSIWEVKGLDDQQHYALKTVNFYEVGHSSLEENPPEKMQVLIYYAQAEIDFLSSLQNSAQNHIVPCLDSGFIEQGNYQLPSMLMPLYPKGDLSCLIKQINNKQTILTGQKWLTWFKQLITALLYMQQAGVDGTPVHRDIKPKNCLLDANDQLFLIDFGIVRESSHTGTTSFVYTFNYCAPEQVLAQYSNAEGRSHYYITPAVDIYAAAILMHEIVSGKVRAQGRLNNPTTKGKHDYALHQLTHPATGKVGLLGEIGGLEEKEADYCRRHLLALFKQDDIAKNKNKKNTKNVSDLPDYEVISASSVDLLQAMLEPWPDDRPSASEVLQHLNWVEDALQPTLSVFDLQPQQTALNVGDSLTLEVIIEGKGLPDHFDWLHVVINDRLLMKPNFSRDSTGKVTFSCAEFKEAIDYTIILATKINGVSHIVKALVRVSLTVEQRWLMGNREEALMLSLNEAWLDEWQNEVSTLREKYDFLLVLERLQQHYVDNELLNKRIQDLEHFESEIKYDIHQRQQKNKKRFVFMLIASMLLLFIVGVASMNGLIQWPNLSVKKQLLPKMQTMIAGRFLMGCVSVKDCKNDETPVLEMDIEAFDIGVTEVTFEQWQACVDNGGCQSNPQPDDAGWGRGKHPVINVTWNDTQEYVQWLSEKTGQNYRLPTEAEWEYAARAGTKSKYWWGNEKPTCSQDDEKGVSHNGGEESDCYYMPDGQLRGTEPVASYQTNPWKLYDMYGNVYEWTCSAYEEYHEGLESVCANAESTRTYVLRGGSWNYDQRSVRSAHRYRYTATGRFFHIGFRVVRERF